MLEKPRRHAAVPRRSPRPLCPLLPLGALLRIVPGGSEAPRVPWGVWITRTRWHQCSEPSLCQGMGKFPPKLRWRHGVCCLPPELKPLLDLISGSRRERCCQLLSRRRRMPGTRKALLNLAPTCSKPRPSTCTLTVSRRQPQSPRSAPAQPWPQASSSRHRAAPSEGQHQPPYEA